MKQFEQQDPVVAEITEAVQILGYDHDGVTIRQSTPGRYTVYSGDFCIGIWDGGRKTFVD